MKEDDQSERPVTAAEVFAVHRLPGTNGMNLRRRCRMVSGQHVCQWEPGQPTTTTDESDEADSDEAEEDN